MTSYLIRPANEDDCEDIMRLSLELAEHEGTIDKVKTNADVLKKDGFGEDPKFRCFVAEQTSDDTGEGRRVIGYSLYYYTYASWVGLCCYMEDLCVTSAWRGKGVGTALWAEVTKTALAKGCVRLGWAVLAWNKPAIKLYRGRGGINITETEERNLFSMSKPVMEQFVAQVGR